MGKKKMKKTLGKKEMRRTKGGGEGQTNNPPGTKRSKELEKWIVDMISP